MEKLIKIAILIYCLIFISIFNKETKVCICTIGKNENKYAIEFVEYYKKYQIDKIFLYDNNDNNGEKFDDILYKYINNGFVELIDFRGVIEAQLKEYKDCYKKKL